MEKLENRTFRKPPEPSGHRKHPKHRQIPRFSRDRMRSKWLELLRHMAEREGFEPPIPVKVCPLSRRIVSTAHAPLRKTVPAILFPATGDFERTFAAVPRCARPEPRCEPRCGDSTACDSAPASPTSQLQLWDLPRHTPAGGCGHES